MGNERTPLLPECYYHVYNHGNAEDNIFRSPENFRYFLQKFQQHLQPILHTYAYCLMPNHFHFLVRIRSQDTLLNLFELASKPLDLERIPNLISRRFGNFLNAYAKAFNKMYNRRGSLFLDNLKRKEVEDGRSLCKLVHYIHHNPVHHKFVKKLSDWEYSNYPIYMGNAKTWIAKEETLTWFGGMEGFQEYHQWEARIEEDLAPYLI